MLLGQIFYNTLSNRLLGRIGKSPVIRKDENGKDEKKPLTKDEKDRTMVIFILVAFCTFFWAGFEQAGSSMSLYTEKFINRDILGYTIPTEWLQSVNPVFIITLAPAFSVLWNLLSRYHKEPSIPVKMVKILLENEEYDCVAAYQEERHEGKMVGGLKNMFYKIINKTSEIEFYPGASDFRTFRRTVVDAILSLPEYHRFSKGIFSWVGFNTCYIPYIAEERNAGETKWSVSKLFKYAIEGFISYTTFPLKIATGIGLFTSLCAIIYLFVVVIQKLCFGNPVPGYPTIVVLILLLGGIQLTILGIIGEYLARMYIQGKHRPIYIEKKLLDYKKDDHEEN